MTTIARLSRTRRTRAALGVAMVALVITATGCVSGPIPGGFPPDPKIPAAGYVEQEYFLTGFPMGETPTEWRDRAALEL